MSIKLHGHLMAGDCINEFSYSSTFFHLLHCFYHPSQDVNLGPYNLAVSHLHELRYSWQATLYTLSYNSELNKDDSGIYYVNKYNLEWRFVHRLFPSYFCLLYTKMPSSPKCQGENTSSHLK